MTATAAHLPRHLRDLHAAHAPGLKPIWDRREGLTVDMKVPASVALTPERTRCKTCRSGLADLAVLRMFCSYRCAGLPTPGHRVADAPRVCKRAARSNEPGEWAFKQRFETAEQAARFIKDGTTLYRCSNCFFLHIGNVSPPPATGIPPAPTSGGTVFDDCVLAVLHGRGQSPDSKAAVAAAKRDVRNVLATLKQAGSLRG
jgi:hypothetical protein